MIFIFSLSRLASLTLDFLENNNSTPNIDCVGDTITYICTILSNIENNLHLTWHITFPGATSMNITYNADSVPGIENYLPMNISAKLTNYEEEFVESTIVFTVTRNTLINGTRLECSIADLKNDSVILYTNQSGNT